MLPQTKNVMKKLRELNRYIGSAAKISEFADMYLDNCLLNAKPVTLITPWSLSRSFIQRHAIQGNKYAPTKAEENLFQNEISSICALLTENGFRFNWWLVFSRSYVRNKAMSMELELEYVNMISGLIDEYQCDIFVVNWEDDVICKNHTPSPYLLDDENFIHSVNQRDFEYDIERRTERAQTTLKIDTEKIEIINETKFKITCEAEEGRFLMQDASNPICEPGEFLFVILGRAERYCFFSTLVPEFEKRIVCVLKPYPWRLNNIS